MPKFDNYSTSLAIYRRSDLDLTETAVAQAILSFRNSDDGRCNPSVFSEDLRKETICTRSKASRRCVLATIQKLEAKGVFRVEKLVGKSSQYVFSESETVLTSESTRAPDAPVHDVHQCTTCTPPVHDVHLTRAPDAPHPCTTCTHNKERTDKEQIKNQIVGDSSFSLEPDQPPAANEVGGSQAAKKAPKSREQKHLFDLKRLPDNWRQYIVKVRPDLDPEVVFTDFAFYWTEGQGRGERRTDRGWSSTWMTWVRRQNNQRSPAARPPKKHIPDHLNPKIRFDESYYAKENPFNPDGSLNWKRAPDTDRNE